MKSFDENMNKLVFRLSAQIEMQQAQEIPPTPTGKVRWIINSYRKP